MSHIITAVDGAEAASVKIKRALLSVSDKSGLVDLAKCLAGHGVELLSTGGTAKAMREAGLTVKDVSEYTGSQEILDGRVKTLHPKIHGGILAVRGNAKHDSERKEADIEDIDLVVLNLYAFEATVAKGSSFDTCVENIDIGGVSLSSRLLFAGSQCSVLTFRPQPSMLRSSAKNHKYVTIASSPAQYSELLEELNANDGCTSLSLRRQFAASAYALSAAYDSAISSWFMGELGGAAPVTSRVYKHELTLKYGCNPHQTPAGLYSIVGTGMPFETLNGTPGYINLLDALNAWQLVKELKVATGLPAAASFKHVSPAGAAVSVELSDVERAVYECSDIELTPSATAYIRARNADPMSSFGDFAALSDIVDEATAKVLKREVSDGIIAPGYEPAALEILKAKKGGKFIVLQAHASFQPPSVEYRELYGMTFQQKRNDAVLTVAKLADVRTKEGLAESAQRDLTVANVAIKYTQSNSVGYSRSGQMVGVGAGQQSRVDCVKLAGRKVKVWHMRFHPKVRGLAFKQGVKRQDRVNARVRYIEGDITDAERPLFEANFDTVPEPLTEQEQMDWMANLTGVALASDAFYPYRYYD
jgi:phosphoribosylaminoimidazolecarboxamide formyltransferase/IMP cyclohydrolase